jgi:Pretoxin HINT domain
VIDGDKHSLGDFFEGALGGCLQGAAFTIPGAEEALAQLEGVGTAAAAADAEGVTGAEDLTTLGDDISGDGTAEDGFGEDSCTTAEANSFPGNTLVELADGTTVPIGRVKPGDYVKATNPATGKTTAAPVLDVIHGQKNELFARITLRIGTGRAARDKVVTATAGHTFYDLTRKAWIEARSLRPGDHLESLNGTPTVIIGVVRYDQSSASVYNLTVGNDHDYYVVVGDTPVLVHNDDDPCRYGLGGERPLKAPSQINTNGGTYATRQQALEAAEKELANLRYGNVPAWLRGECTPTACHLHVDIYNKFGQLLETIHYTYQRP